MSSCQSSCLSSWARVVGSPKTGPGIMCVRGVACQGGSYASATERGAHSRPVAASEVGAAAGAEPGGLRPQAGRLRDDLASLAGSLRADRLGEDRSGLRPGGGGRPAEAAGGGVDARQADAAGHRPKKVVSLRQQRTAAGYLEVEYRISQRRAARVLKRARSSLRYRPRPRSGEEALVKAIRRLARRH